MQLTVRGILLLRPCYRKLCKGIFWSLPVPPQDHKVEFQSEQGC